jgi:hypothetical protein
MQRGKPLAFLYKLSEIFLENRLFLITSAGSSDEIGTISTSQT